MRLRHLTSLASTTCRFSAAVKMSTKSKVCIIGGGAAGLCAARHLAPLSQFEPIVYELSDTIGGTWVYNDKTGVDDHGLPIHSSMYQGLKTNLPKEVMAFPDFPFPDVEDSFLHHEEVYSYLRKYAVHFGLDKYIRYKTLVRHVIPVKNGEGFNVSVEDLETGETATSFFAAVMVCNGHYSVPSIPKIDGMSNFRGTVMHSHDYRTPQSFQDKTVAVLGAAASGTDIGIEIATAAKRLYLCHNNPVLPSQFSPNMEQRKGICKVVGGKDLELSDGTTVTDVDVILLCTGYLYSFPFLDTTCHPKIENRVVWPLYKHMIHIDFPALCFIGVPIQICPFPQFHLQVQFFLKSLTAEMELPSKEAMMSDTEEEKNTKQKNGVPAKHFHKMGASQWDYNRSLCKLANLSEIPSAVEKLYNDVWATRRHNLTSYKKNSYVLNGDYYERKMA